MIEWTQIAGSSAINAIGREFHDVTPGSSTRIHVRFKRGKTYVYEVGSAAYFERFVSAASKGRFYCFVIKERFDYVLKY